MKSGQKNDPSHTTALPMNGCTVAQFGPLGQNRKIWNETPVLALVNTAAWQVFSLFELPDDVESMGFCKERSEQCHSSL